MEAEVEVEVEVLVEVMSAVHIGGSNFQIDSERAFNFFRLFCSLHMSTYLGRHQNATVMNNIGWYAIHF